MEITNNKVKDQDYTFPPVEFLLSHEKEYSSENHQAETAETSKKIAQILRDFDIEVKVVGATRSASVTRYELELGNSALDSDILKHRKEIAFNLGVSAVRIAPLPGKPFLGVEVPNRIRSIVSLKELIDSDAFRSAEGELPFVIGRNIDGENVIGDLAALRHLLVAGTLGSGKAEFPHSVILSFLYHSSPDDLRLILIDPKKVELGAYLNIPHLLTPNIINGFKGAAALEWAVGEMSRRYKILEAAGVRQIKEYNRFAEEKLPRIVIYIDELADLMLDAKTETEESILKLAQHGHDVRIHMILSTHYPRTDILPFELRDAFPNRIVFSVCSVTDSRVILGETGAEDLLLFGDMLFKTDGHPYPERIQAPFVSTKEKLSVAKFFKDRYDSNYSQDIAAFIEKRGGEIYELEMANNELSNNRFDDDNDYNDLIEKAIDEILESGNASTAFLQRKLNLGFPKAARIIDVIEEMGIIGPQEGVKPRKINISKEEWDRKKTQNNSKK